MKAVSSKRCGVMPPVIALLIVFAILAGAATFFFNATSPQIPSDNSIKKFSSYGELESYLKSSSSGGVYSAYGVAGGVAMKSSVAPQATSESVVFDSSDYSRTNVQVEGVDEADFVKNDGKYIYAVSGNKIAIIDAYPAETAKKVSEIGFNGTIRDIFINGNKLVVFGQEYQERPIPADIGGGPAGEPTSGVAEKMMVRPDIYPVYTPNTAVMIYDISDKSSPNAAGKISLDGDYYNSRMINNFVYVVASESTYYAAGQKVVVPEIKADGRVITPAFPDVYYFDGVPGNTFTTIAAINLDNPNDIASKVILTNYAQNMYVSEKNIYITYTKWLNEMDYIDRAVEIVRPLVPPDIRAKIDSAMALDISKRIKWEAVSEILNEYSNSLSYEDRQALEEKGREQMEKLQEEIAREREKTVVQRIAIDNGYIEFKANGEVPGTTLNQFSMDENNGYLRIATTTSGSGGVVTPMVGIAQERAATSNLGDAVSGSTPPAAGGAAAGEAATGNVVASSTASTATSSSKPSAGITLEEQKRIEQATPSQIAPRPPTQRSTSKNHVYVLDGDLKIVGKLEDLASGERIYSVRFLGDKAYMVTFRQVDPLYVIDLSAPENPRVLGYLKIPGVSDYLHPYDATHVIGVGRDATDEGRMKGMKISLFDVTDVANPQEVSKYIIGESGTYSEVLNDHKAFLFSREKNLLVFPVQVTEGGKWNAFQGAYVFNIDLASGISLKGKVTHQKDVVPDSTKDYYDYDYTAQIRRSLYIGDVLYTVSQKMVKMNSLSDLGELNTVALPYSEERYRIMY